MFGVPDRRRPGHGRRHLQRRPLTEQAFRYVFVDATYCKARVGGRVVSQAVVIATSVSADGRPEVLGGGDSEIQAFCMEFLPNVCERGPNGVQLVISDHPGLMNASRATMIGASWQRCRVHHADVRIIPTSRPKSLAASGFTGSTSP